MGSSDVRTCVTEATQDRNHARGALEPRGFSLVFRLDFVPNLLDQLGCNPAAGRFAFRHLFRGLQAENIDVPQHRVLNVAFIEVPAKFSELADVKAELCNRIVGAGRKFFFQLQILVSTIRLCVFER